MGEDFFWCFSSQLHHSEASHIDYCMWAFVVFAFVPREGEIEYDAIGFTRFILSCHGQINTVKKKKKSGFYDCFGAPVLESRVEGGYSCCFLQEIQNYLGNP